MLYKITEAFRGRKLEDKNYDTLHARRWNLTNAALDRFFLYREFPTRWLALGSDGQFENQFGTRHPGATFDFSSWDLRHPFPVLDESYQCIISLEVIEHLKDRNGEDEDIAAHEFTGLFNFLLESNRVLVDGGRLILSTPNSSSWQAMWQIFTGETNFLYWPHVRELAPFELARYLKSCGFKIVELQSFSPYDGDFRPNPIVKALHMLLILVLRADRQLLKLRGKTQIVIAEKVAKPDMELLNTGWKSITPESLGFGND